MPVRGTCLLNTTALKDALFDLVEFTAYERLKNGKQASIESVYGDIRKAGGEVDLPTIGEIYSEVLPRDDANFSSDVEIDDVALKTWRQSINNLIPPATENEDDVEQDLPVITGEDQIGQEKPESQLVEFILNAVFSDVAINERTKSDMKALQDALWKGMQRKLGPRPSKTRDRKTMKELINESLGWEKMGVEDVNGKLNSISDLFNAMRDQLELAATQIQDAAYPAAQERFDEY